MSSKLEETWDRQPNESWDQYVVRKMQEEKRGEVYPVREDVPADLWGKPIVKKGDAVNHPLHYNIGIETNKYIKSWNMSYAQGNVIKYITRYNVKSKDVDLQIQDLQKAKWYLEDLIKELEKTNSH